MVRSFVSVTCARKPKVFGSSPAASYVQRWGLFINLSVNVYISVKRVEDVESS